MSSEQHGTRLELIIILLIAVEVVFELRRIILEWGQEREAEAKAQAEALAADLTTAGQRRA